MKLLRVLLCLLRLAMPEEASKEGLCASGACDLPQAADEFAALQVKKEAESQADPKKVDDTLLPNITTDFLQDGKDLQGNEGIPFKIWKIKKIKKHWRVVVATLPVPLPLPLPPPPPLLLLPLPPPPPPPLVLLLLVPPPPPPPLLLLLPPPPLPIPVPLPVPVPLPLPLPAPPLLLLLLVLLLLAALAISPLPSRISMKQVMATPLDVSQVASAGCHLVLQTGLVWLHQFVLSATRPDTVLGSMWAAPAP